MKSILKNGLRVAGTAALLLGGSPAWSQAKDPIVIGVPVPLSGTLAEAGQLVATGVRYATEELNKKGGILGHQVELKIEDTKSEANTAASVATKMVTLDKVYAFVGGFGSTPDFAMLQSLKRYSPIFMHVSSGSVRLEKQFGPEPWYFHLYIWDYYRQKAAAKFLSSLGVKTVAIAYEDGLNGSDSSKYAQQYMGAAGLEIVMNEPFRSGSPDFSPILNRVKRLNPDVLFFNGYRGDSIQVVRQATELGIRPKLMLLVSSGEKRSDFGDWGNGVAFIQEWAAQQKGGADPELYKRIEERFPEMAPVRPSIMLGYAGLMTLAESIEAAGTLDKEAVLKQLSAKTFETPFGKLGYGRSDGGAVHQLTTENSEIIVQYTKDGLDVVWPSEKASGSVRYPAN